MVGVSVGMESGWGGSNMVWESDEVRLASWKNLAPRFSSIYTKDCFTKGARGIVQLVECLSITLETLNMISSITNTGCGGAYLQSRHSGSGGRRIRSSR